VTLKDPIKRREYQQKWRSEHVGYYTEWMKRYNRDHREEYRAYREKNKKRISLRASEWHTKNRSRILEEKKKRSRMSNYGVSEQDYKVMLSQQDGACAICGKNKNYGGPGNCLQIDHCHDKGVVRGLLCSNCNTGLGKFGDDIEIMERAVKYLKTFCGSYENGRKRVAA
jgi:hypothetical protein